MGSPSDGTIAKRYFIRGRVQGVGYRYFAQRAAVELGVAGYTRNLADGRVEVYACGSPDKLSDLSAILRQGPRFSQVRGVDEEDAAPERCHGFLIQ